MQPENIILDRDFNAVLTDFGSVVHLPSSEHRTLTGKSVQPGDQRQWCIGTDEYAPPEAVSGAAYCPQKYDVWSLGLVLFLLTCIDIMGYADNGGREKSLRMPFKGYFDKLSLLPNLDQPIPGYTGLLSQMAPRNEAFWNEFPDAKARPRPFFRTPPGLALRYARNWAHK